MPSLTMPVQIWISMTAAEKDAFYLQAGFDPNFPVVDNGTDSTTVRFTQTIPFTGDFNTGPPGIPPSDPVLVATPTLQAGDDLRDFPQGQAVSLTGDNPVTDEMGVPVAGTSLAIAGRALKLILGGGGGRLTSAIWNSLPSFVRTVLIQFGIGIGALIAFSGDIPFITLPGQQSDFDESQEGGAIIPTGPPVDIQIGTHPDIPGVHLGAHIIGSWNTNPANPALGVTFYRLSDGKLAVKNKKGKWKVWRPKKPIVLYASGASNLKTMLRADKALNKQAKAIAAMLNRRAPRPRKKDKDDKPTIVVASHSRIID